jgi:hypothetical protein
MNLEQMISTLRSEREALDAAILVLERLASTQQRRRGRPPAWLQVRREEKSEPERGSKRTRKMSEETKKKMAEAQRKRWAAYRKEKHN